MRITLNCHVSSVWQQYQDNSAFSRVGNVHPGDEEADCLVIMPER